MGFVKDLGRIFTGVLSPIGSILSVVTGIATALQAFKPPKIPKFEVPKEIFTRLEQRIAAITPISEEGRRIATEALAKFREGILDPRYKAKLDLAYQQKRAQAQALLAARGLTGSSIEQEVINEIDRWYQQNYYTLLNQQLQDALTLAGLGKEDINALLSEIQAYSSAFQAQATGLAAGAMIEAGRMIGLGKGLENLRAGIEGITKSSKVETPKVETPKVETKDVVKPPELDFSDLGG